VLDLGGEAAALGGCDAAQRVRVRRLVAGFCVAEVAVAAHLAPFAARGSGADARACFALQAGDEARHARFFARVAVEVCGLDDAAVRALAGAELVALFEDDLPRVADALAADRAGLEDAVGLYHLVLEGIVFAIGQSALLDELDAVGGLPQTREGVARVQADERWHVGLGVLCLHERGAMVDVREPAARAAAAWGPDVATPERVAAVLAAHERRVGLVAGGRRVGAGAE
jgi:ribonucleoside-diphosphate reductase beta chain